MILQPGQHILFVGDSITDCYRLDMHKPFGNGFASIVQSFINARYPELHLTWTNTGISGNTIRDMANRWEDDVIAMNPDWLILMVGANDCSRRYNPERIHEAVYADEYAATMRSLLRRAVASCSCRIAILEPFVIEANDNDQRLQDTRELCSLARDVAAEMNALSVHTQELFDHVLKSTAASDWSPDRVHPNMAGHSLIAMGLLRELGFELAETGR